MNREAIGLSESEVETPALCLDLAVYRRNVARMVDFITTRHGLAWRPHMKGQKAPPLAIAAVKAGAVGVTCATVYEAEAMAEAGVESILLANQAVGERKLARLAGLQRMAEVIAATDSLEHAAMVSAAAVKAGVVIPALIEINVGMNRCGVAPGASTLALARSVQESPGLRLAGVMGWEGHAVPLGADKADRIADSMQTLVQCAAELRAAGLNVPIVSASGSGTFRHSAATAGLTEIQAGGGVFCDLNYRKWGLDDHEFALTVLTRVISRPAPNRIIVDAGFKTLSVQHGLPEPLGLPPVAKLALSAEHGTIELEAPSDSPRVGETVRFIPGYTDSTVCLHDEMCVIEQGVVKAVWPIPGRGGVR